MGMVTFVLCFSLVEPKRFVRLKWEDHWGRENLFIQVCGTSSSIISLGICVESLHFITILGSDDSLSSHSTAVLHSADSLSWSTHLTGLNVPNMAHHPVELSIGHGVQSPSTLQIWESADCVQGLHLHYISNYIGFILLACRWRCNVYPFYPHLVGVDSICQGCEA